MVRVYENQIGSFPKRLGHDHELVEHCAKLACVVSVELLVDEGLNFVEADIFINQVVRNLLDVRDGVKDSTFKNLRALLSRPAFQIA